MVKVEVIEVFHLEKYNEIKDTIERKGYGQDGYLYVGDKFVCTEELAEYLAGKNAKNKPYIKVIEVIPEPKKKEAIEEPVKEEETTKKTTARKGKKVAQKK